MLPDAAAAAFVRAGVDAPAREIAAESGLGMGTFYRRFPTRADLVAAAANGVLRRMRRIASSSAAGD
jgi:AcrR family transcriptional regulator